MCTWTGRVKSINGIFRKMFLQGKTLEEIYDVYAVRVIVDTRQRTVTTCWGSSTTCSSPLPNRFKDYISTPKAEHATSPCTPR